MYRKIRQNQILRIALPAIVSNITVPLLGLVDVAIVGHLGTPSYIGAIAIGGMIFNIIYWIFGFLRMGTSGLTAQAFGASDHDEVVRLLIRSVGVGFLISLLLLILQYPLIHLAFRFISSTTEVKSLASTYFNILIWGAPATLGLYGFSGWFIGMQNTRIPMMIAITQNVVNILAAVLLVYGCGLKIEGVAIGTLVAQYTGLLMAIKWWYKHFPHYHKRIVIRGVWNAKVMKHFFRVNRDIFLRTICLVAVTMFFTTAGASQGDTILAVNTLLMQLFTIFSYFMDGFAYAGEALVGKYTGAKNQPALNQTVKQIFRWGVGISFCFMLLYFAGGKAFLSFLTNDPTVINLAGNYTVWAMLIPLAGFAAFLWDGIFIGATGSKQMLVSMAIATFTFFAVYFVFRNQLGNHALWLAFLLYLSIRGGVQTLLSEKILKIDPSKMSK